MADRIRVLIADDHTIFRAGVRLLLENEPDIEIVGEALDGTEAINLAGSLQPDVILMDIAMPGTNGLEATRVIKNRFPAIKILVLTMHRSEEYFFEMIKAGASGYVLKAAEINDLLVAIHAVYRDEVFLYPEMAKHLLQDYLNRIDEREHPDGLVLTSREKEILRLIAEGYGNVEIAERLVLSTSTVYTHRSNLMKKLNLSSRYDLIQYARSHGLVPDN